ncbi:MAG: hypothetical protein JXR37_04740 [Kiritimatiellae bacterium]|nr:hypothetical protein [Kiritimatiellia bacterium]
MTSSRRQIVAATGAFLLLFPGPFPCFAWDPLAVTNDPYLRLPGTQPHVLTLEAPNNCMNCHAGYDLPVEPGHNWRGSMMGQTARDPLFYACFTVAAQDSIWALGNPNAADLCMRCHFPKGWLEGRSDPPNASLMTGFDFDGVQCDFCHSLYDPFFAGTYAGTREGSDWTHYWDEANQNVPSSASAAGAVYETDSHEAANVFFYNGAAFYSNNVPVGSAYTENGAGQFFISIADNRAKRASFTDAPARHSKLYSRYHKSKYFCQTCHDVSNPALANLGQDGSEPLTSETNAPFMYMHVERTFSEFMLSDFGLQGGAAGTNDYAPGVFDTSRPGDAIATCQACHMPDAVGKGCNKNDGVLRPSGSQEHPISGQPVHDLTGGNMWIPYLLASAVSGSPNYSATNEALLAQGPSVLTLDLTQGLGLDADALLGAVDRAHTNLMRSASISDLSYDFVAGSCAFRVHNHTPHKLISGFPEGRRMFVNVRVLAGTNLVYEINPYDSTAGTLRGLPPSYSTNSPALNDGETHIDELVYEMHPSSSRTGESETFHFALADGRYKDNRIPPRGFRIAEAGTRLCEPVWHGVSDTNYFTGAEYAGGYDAVSLALPPGADGVEIRLFYQTTSREYIEFLRDEINGTASTLSNPGAGGDAAYLIQSDVWFTNLAAWGDTIWALWQNNKDVPGAAPVLMCSATMHLDTSDSDGDEIPAYWELAYFGGPTNAAPENDSDGDGILDYSEYVALTVPTNAASLPLIDDIQFGIGASGTVVTVSFTSHYARVYGLQTATDLTGTVNWTNIVPLRAGAGGLMSLTHTNDLAHAFYRLEIDLP